MPSNLSIEIRNSPIRKYPKEYDFDCLLVTDFVCTPVEVSWVFIALKTAVGTPRKRACIAYEKQIHLFAGGEFIQNDP